MHAHHPVLLTAFLAMLCPLAAVANTDVAGAKDHPMFTRMNGYYIGEFAANDFASHGFTVGGRDNPAEKVVEGRKTHLHYTLKEGAKAASALQIVRNYTGAAKAIGGRQIHENPDPGDYLITLMIQKPGQELWIEVRAADGTDGYLVTIVEKAAMAQEITAADILSKLNRDGRVALYILFDTGKAAIKPESAKIIEEVSAMLKEQGALQLAVEGHTDNVGNAPANKTLSQQRAQAVVNALVAKGVAVDRLVASGFGQERPVADNRAEAGRAQNRRVELVKR